MHFVIHALDRPDAGDLRSRTRPDHLAYLEGFKLTFGGPMLDDQGEMCGSLIVLDVEDRAAAEAFAAGDPYAKASLFSQVTITRWRPVFGV
ncbi:MAG: hypothetical protein CL466_05680 [Acidimicrobiaceae bacterium]|nr:hypothetical protein [Acidimicrobiaceae bacterium]